MGGVDLGQRHLGVLHGGQQRWQPHEGVLQRLQQGEGQPQHHVEEWGRGDALGSGGVHNHHLLNDSGV